MPGPKEIPNTSSDKGAKADEQPPGISAGRLSIISEKNRNKTFIPPGFVPVFFEKNLDFSAKLCYNKTTTRANPLNGQPRK